MTGMIPARRQPSSRTVNCQQFGSWTTMRSPRRRPRSSVSFAARASARAVTDRYVSRTAPSITAGASGRTSAALHSSVPKRMVPPPAAGHILPDSLLRPGRRFLGDRGDSRCIRHGPSPSTRLARRGSRTASRASRPWPVTRRGLISTASRAGLAAEQVTEGGQDLADRGAVGDWAAAEPVKQGAARRARWSGSRPGRVQAGRARRRRRPALRPPSRPVRLARPGRNRVPRCANDQVDAGRRHRLDQVPASPDSV